MTKQDTPFSIQIEPCEGCSMACDFCGIHGIREKQGNYKFMTIDTARIIADEIARLQWESRIEFAMHGEPTMNPNLVEIIRIFRDRLPKHQLMLTSNGSGLLKEGRVKDLLNAGLDILALDDYKDGYVARVLPNIPEGVTKYNYPEDDRGNPHRRYKRSSFPFVSVIADIGSTTTGVHGKLSNHTGCAFPPDHSMQGKRCAKPFRELAIRWDGSVAICCEDWRGKYAIGNVRSSPIDELWNNEAFTIARKHLYHGQRTFAPCEGCNNRSYRVGLLPDKLGKMSLPEPTAEEHARAQQIGGGATLTPVILRPWERSTPAKTKGESSV